MQIKQKNLSKKTNLTLIFQSEIFDLCFVKLFFRLFAAGAFPVIG